MKRMLLAAGLLLTASGIFAEDPAAGKAGHGHQSDLFDFGTALPTLHANGRIVAAKQKGVKAVKVDWATKSAKVEFDETVLPVQQLAAAVAATPHMMGGGMSYGSWLALSVPEIKDEASAKMAEMAVHDIKGVTSVGASPSSIPSRCSSPRTAT